MGGRRSCSQHGWRGGALLLRRVACPLPAARRGPRGPGLPSAPRGPAPGRALPLCPVGAACSGIRRRAPRGPRTRSSFPPERRGVLGGPLAPARSKALPVAPSPAAGTGRARRSSAGEPGRPVAASRLTSFGCPAGSGVPCLHGCLCQRLSLHSWGGGGRFLC